MAGGSARHMERGDGRDRGRRSRRPRGHRFAVILALALSVVALGMVLAVRVSGGGVSAADEAQAPTTLGAEDGAQATNGTAADGSALGNDTAQSRGGGDSPESEDVSADGASAPESAEGSDAREGEDGEGQAAAPGTGTASGVRSAVEPLVGSASGTVSVAYASLADTSDACYLQADRQVRSASMIKLAILAEYLREVDAGTLSGGESYTLKASDIVGGTGSLQGRGAGYSTTYDDLARLMICESDNVAANVLIDRMGMDAINAEASSLGLSSTVLERKMMDSSALAAGRDNYTSARDVARVLELIGTGELVSREASAKALGWLEQQTDRAGIPAGLPSGTTVGNKTGSLEAARHDGALVLGEHPYVLVVMTDGMGTTAADVLIARISQTVWGAVS